MTDAQILIGTAIGGGLFVLMQIVLGVYLLRRQRRQYRKERRRLRVELGLDSGLERERCLTIFDLEPPTGKDASLEDLQQWQRWAELAHECRFGRSTDRAGRTS